MKNCCNNCKNVGYGPKEGDIYCTFNFSDENYRCPRFILDLNEVSFNNYYDKYKE